MTTLLLNYSHPLSDAQFEAVVAIVGVISATRTVATLIDRTRPMADVARDLADAAGLSPDEWQTVPLVINPPALAPVALALTAELHGRCGGFPTIINIRPIEGSMPTRYEVAEVLNLQSMREAARARR